MKFAKLLEQKLVEENIPEEWMEAAIQYKALKKCINKVVEELEQMGLEQNTLKFLIEKNDGQNVVEIDRADYTPTNPVIANYTLTRARWGKNKQIVPVLEIAIDLDEQDEARKSVALSLKQKIDELAQNNSIVEKVTLSRHGSHDENRLVLSPKYGPQDSNIEEIEGIDEHMSKNANMTGHKEIIRIILKSDAEFFQMLDEELERLGQLRDKEESKLLENVEHIRDEIQTTSDPTKMVAKKSDLYAWRELLKIYLDSEVFFKYNETSSTAFARNEEQIKQNLDQFVLRIKGSGVVDKFRGKRSVAAFQEFVRVNYDLLRVLKFQAINSTALRKILKKFDKQTSLGVKYKFPQLVSNEKVFLSGSSIAKSICYVMQSSLSQVVPLLDDYSCPICTSIAFKPIKLECGHRFCVRCLVKLKHQDKTDCPFCRHPGAVTKADSLNLDVKAMKLMQLYFPKEVKEKMKERDKEKYNELVGNGKCVIT